MSMLLLVLFFCSDISMLLFDRASLQLTLILCWGNDKASSGKGGYGYQTILLPYFFKCCFNTSCSFLRLSLHLPPKQYSGQTGKGCIFCHQESTGGALKTGGIAYINNGYHYPIPERILKKAEFLQTPLHKTLRFIIGYLHLLAAVVFFGAIFYIHIFVRPVRLIGGIPKHERILGVSCMLTLAVTGTYLTWARISRWGQFFDNTFGLMLFIKILLFLVMVALGVIAITFIHRRMQQDVKKAKETSWR